MNPLTVYPFAAPLLADLDAHKGSHSYLPVRREIAERLHGIDHVLVSIQGHLLRTELQERSDGQVCVQVANIWIEEHGLELGELLDIELAADLRMERRRMQEAEAAAAHLMRPLPRMSA